MSKQKSSEADNSNPMTATVPGEFVTPPKRKPDAEIQMMARIDKMLSGIDQQAADRVVAWLASRRFGGHWSLNTPEKMP